MIVVLLVDGLLVASVKTLFAIALVDSFITPVYEPGDPTRLPRAIARWRWRLSR